MEVVYCRENTKIGNGLYMEMYGVAKANYEVFVLRTD